MKDAHAEFGLNQAEEAVKQHAILESIPSEMEVVMNHRFIHEANVKRELVAKPAI